MKYHPWRIAGAVVVVSLLTAGGGWWWTQGRAPAVAYRTSAIERGSLQSTVSASGTVNPVTQVSVSTQVSGQIKDLLVDFNSEVRAGQLIARIDPETFEYRERQAIADVDVALAAVLTAQANSAAARAAVSRATVDHTEAQRDLERKKSLVEKQFITQSEADRAQALVNTTREMLSSAQAQLGVTEAQVKSAQASVAQRQAALAQARVDLARTRITSPVNGIVIKRTVEKGQTVAASLQAPELFVIAQNLQDMQVDASIDESDVSRIRLGQRVSFTVDAFPGQNFDGEVRQVRKAAQTIANVVTYVAVIGFSNTGGRLLPGMTANVRVVTDTRENALKVPNAALRVRIAGVDPAQGAAPAAAPPASGASPARTTTGQGGWSLFPSAYAQPAPGGGGGGGIPAMRDRLVEQLSLTTQQQASLDAIMADLRPRFLAIRDLPEGERRQARDQALADMRTRVTAILTPPQRQRYEQMQAAAAGGGTGNPPSVPTPSTAAAPRGLGAAPSVAQGAPRIGGPAAAAAPEGAAGGNPAAEFRQRLVTELELTPGQRDKLDAINADMRPKLMQLRELPAEERPKARERIMADMRARIGDVLDAQQKVKYQAMLAQATTRTVTRGRIYLLDSQGKPRAYNVRLGISDGTSTELLVAPGSPEAVDLKEGATVITGILGSAAPAPAARPGGPRLAF